MTNYKNIKIDIDDVEFFDTRTRNILHRLGVETVGDLLKYRKSDLLKIRDCGPKTVRRIGLFLQDINNGRFQRTSFQIVTDALYEVRDIIDDAIQKIKYLEGGNK